MSSINVQDFVSYLTVIEKGMDKIDRELLDLNVGKARQEVQALRSAIENKAIALAQHNLEL